jgi:formylglycine-generating enzyme required for sulfatase activity
MHGCDAGTAFVAGGKLRVAYRADAVTVADLCMDLTPVTVDGWRACVERGACKDPKGRGELCSWERPDHGRHPITCVRQPEAEGYCAAVGGRLPTEEEWEWAARGGARGTAYPWGSQAPRGQLCWSGKAKREGTCAVGTFPQGRSPDGLYDLAGNVEVWTSSSFDPDSSRLRVIRGSAWTTDVSSQVSPAERSRSIPDAEYSRTGLRCVKGPRAVAK